MKHNLPTVKCLFFFFGMACGILASQLGIQTVLSAVEAWSPNHWIATGYPKMQCFLSVHFIEFWQLYTYLKQAS